MGTGYGLKKLIEEINSFGNHLIINVIACIAINTGLVIRCSFYWNMNDSSSR